jgi:hypothetical protein
VRAGIVAIIFFAGLLALGHYVAAPLFCRGELPIPALDARALCGADMHLNRQGSILLYFASIAAAMFFGILAGAIPSRGKKSEKGETKSETFEEIVAAKEKQENGKAAPTSAATPAPVTSAAAGTSAARTEAAAPVVIGAPHPSALGISAPAEKAETKSASATSDTKSETPAAPEKQPEKPVAAEAPTPPPDPATLAASEAITAGLAAKKSGASKNFDGTNEELMERFRELKKQEGVNAIAQAQRLLDESTLSALSKGVDPKQHLSQVAHLVLADDPDLKSGVVRGVVVHVAARLKELGVVNQPFQSPSKPAA